MLSIAAARAHRLETDWDTLQIPVPWFVGRRIVRLAIQELVPFVDWTRLPARWGVEGAYAPAPGHEEGGPAAHELLARAQVMLARAADAKRLTAQGVYGFWPANTDGDDIIVYKDDARATQLVRFHTLRQQDVADGSPCLSLADFVAPKESFAPDYIGAFAVTVGIGAREFEAEYENAPGDGVRLARAVAALLAEACAEHLHVQARRDWGYARHDNPSVADVLARRYRGIRAVFGEPECPDRSEMPALFRLLHAEQEGMTLTERFTVMPAASVSGIYLSHPQARSFDVGRIGLDQVSDYAARKGVSVAEAERWLTSNLEY